MVQSSSRFEIALVAQPSETAAAAIAALGQTLSYSRVRIAVAYASELGVLKLDELMSSTPMWHEAEKRFLVSIDNGITQPAALTHLASLQSSKVRVPGASMTLKDAHLRKRPSFHAKCYCFDIRKSTTLSVGGLIIASNNLTSAGLEENFELAVSLKGGNPEDPILGKFDAWWSGAWQSAEPLTDVLLDTYRNRRAKTLGAQAGDLPEGEPSPTELGNAKSLWIMVGFLSGGAHNQLELPQGVAAFFGLDAAIKGEAVDFQLTSGDHTWDSWIKFWGNGVWRLRLPTAAQGGPPFTGTLIRLDRGNIPNSYVLRTAIEESDDANEWIHRSEQDGGIQFTMKGSGGRMYGWF